MAIREMPLPSVVLVLSLAAGLQGCASTPYEAPTAAESDTNATRLQAGIEEAIPSANGERSAPAPTRSPIAPCRGRSGSTRRSLRRE